MRPISKCITGDFRSMKQQVYLTIIGKNDVGIIASVTNCLLNYRISIQDITQKILDDKFVLFMVLECESHLDVSNLQTHLEEAVRRFRVKIMLAQEDLFNSMHRI